MNETVLTVLRVMLFVAMLVAMVVVPVVLVLWFRKAGANDGSIRLMYEVIEKLVLAAEQIYSSEAGQVKKDWVLNTIEDWSRRNKIPFDRGLADAVLEAAVYQLINGPRGVKAEQVKTAIAVTKAGGNPESLPFVHGEAPVIDGPPPAFLEN